ncbi:cellulase family glycosylhydrolase [Paenibacillaceae bacterium WGS1546]|uniref:cellulase family glycosylhydrolase n=1 Tax=Cohnella sp. WGS1546 TaxID=3366810 RepID=UPI00372CE8AC
MKAGRPYKGAGVNFFNAFSRTLANDGDKSYLQGFEELKSFGIPFIRFMAGGYWPNDYRLYFEDKARYFALLDRFVEDAERMGLGLIPSLFWHHSTIPDLMKEPRNRWGDPGSRTISFMKQYVSEFAGRYAHSPAIWGWEFGNEYNLEQDLPNARDCRPPIVPHMGTSETRTAEDDLTSGMLDVAYRLFAEEVRGFDSHRILVSGNSIPRATAWNQRCHLSFIQDTETQFQEALALENPDPFDVLSAHYYLNEGQRFGAGQDTDKIMELMQQAARALGKPLFVGEFGVSDKMEDGSVDHERGRRLFADMVDSLKRADVPLSALWVYDYAPQTETTVTGANKRAYQLEMLQQWNESRA